MCRILQRPPAYLLASLMLSGCTAYNPEDHYDPNAVEKVGLITFKSLAKIEKLPAKPKGEILSLPINGAIKTIYIPSTDKPSYRKIYEYVVEVSDNEKVSVLDLYSAYNIGDCAKVFISPKASYPRIASGSGCPASAPQPVMAEHGSDPFPNSYARADARLEKEMHSLRNLEALARCNKDPRCIRVAVMSNQHAFEYTEKVVDRIRSLSATVPPLEKSNAGEQSVKTLIMLTVDGAITSMLTVKTSKNQKLDGWANRLLIRAAPFQPFDQHLSESADSIVMNVEFRFDGNKLIYVNSETNETRLNSELVHEQNNQERR